MLALAQKQAIEAALDSVLTTLGSPAVWARPSAPVLPPVSLIAGLASVKPSDEAAVNSYGIDGRIITLRAADVAANPPLKFDTVTIGTDKLVLDTIHPVYVNADLKFYRCFVKGHRP